MGPIYQVKGGCPLSLEHIDFCKFEEIAPDIIETTVNDGVELDLHKISMVITELKDKYPSPFAILSNRINSYSHTHESMAFLANQDVLYAYAILAHRPLTHHCAIVQTYYQENAKLFYNREKAIIWLENQRKPLHNMIEKPQEKV